MRKLFALACTLLLLCALSLGVSAETGAASVSIHATVSPDSSCQVTLTAMLHLEQATGDLRFPLPLEAKSITLNGSRVHAAKTDNAKVVDLSGITGSLAGDFSVTMTYMLDDVVHMDENELLQLQLPLLSGFSYPIGQLDFSVTMPGQIDAKPGFSSGYHQANIEKDLTCTVSGAAITGTSSKALKDHETLVMTVPVSAELFPQTGIELPDFNMTNTLMLVFALLALVYWLVFLRCALPRPMTVSTPPEGFSAGQLGCVLSMEGANLTMMVFSWAQLGYVRIRTDKHGRVMLHKRMDMGNERSGFEQRCFKNLFSKRSDTVDTSGYHYAMMWQKIAKLPPNIQGLVHPKSGSIYVFRALTALIGLFGGAGLGIALGAGAAAQWLLVLLLAVFGGISTWHMSRWTGALFCMDKGRLWLSLALGALWLLLGILGGAVALAVWVLLSQLLAGPMVFFGNRRTEAGKQAMSEVLGLRRYLRTVKAQELQRIMLSNPEYFYSLAPYALALGVDKAFAGRFGKQKLPDCPYLAIGGEPTAAQWNELLRRTARAMDTRRKNLPKEKLLGILQSFIR